MRKYKFSFSEEEIERMAEPDNTFKRDSALIITASDINSALSSFYELKGYGIKGCDVELIW